MRFGKRTMFFFLQGVLLLVLLLHLGRWLFSDTVEGHLVRPYSPTVMTAQYTVDGVEYTGTYMRNEYPLSEKTVSIRYLVYNPAKSRINNFISIAGEPLAWWMMLSMGMAALLLTDNTVFSKGTTFQLHKRFPWISMDEYFPIKSRWFHREAGEGYRPRTPQNSSGSPTQQQLPGQKH